MAECPLRRRQVERTAQNRGGKVLSTAVTTPRRRAAARNSGRSPTSSMGLVGLSNQARTFGGGVVHVFRGHAGAGSGILHGLR